MHRVIGHLIGCCVVGILLAQPQPVQAQRLNTLQIEHGDLVRARLRLQRQIRNAYRDRNFDEVLRLCDELDALAPGSGIATYYRTEAHRRMAEIKAGIPPEEVLPFHSRPKNLPSPTPAKPEQPGPALSSPPPPKPAPPRPVSPQRNLLSFALGLLFAVLALIALLLGIGALILRRRVGRGSLEQKQPLETAGMESELPAAATTEISGAEEPEIPQPVETAPEVPGEQATGAVASLLPPGKSLDETIAAIREEFEHPIAKPASEPPPEEPTPKPIALEEVTEPLHVGSIPAQMEASPETTVPPPASSKEKLDLLRPDEVFFTSGEKQPTPFSESEPPTASPPKAPAEPASSPAAAMATDPFANLEPLARGTTPHAKESDTPPVGQQPAQLFDEEPDDLAIRSELPPLEPAHKAAKEVTPLDLDELLGTGKPETPLPEESTPTEPATPPPTGPPDDETTKALRVDLEASTQDLAIDTSPTEEITRTLQGDEMVTQVLDPGELRKVLSQVPPPTETMSTDEGQPHAAAADTAGPPATTEEQFIDYYKRGLRAFDEQDWDQAISWLEFAARLRPDSTEVIQKLHAAREAKAKTQASSKQETAEKDHQPPKTPGL